MNTQETEHLNERRVDRLWLVLIALTLANAAIAERAEPGLLVTLAICGIIVFKARMVIDHFMELKGASPYIYHLMNAYFYVFPFCAVLVWLFPDTLAEWTRLSH